MMKFNLEKALAGEPVVTRDGKPVTQLTKFDTTDKHCLVCVVDGDLKINTIEGRSFHSGFSDEFDLFMAEPEIWVNLCIDPKGYPFFGGGIYGSKEEAANAPYEISKGSTYNQTIRIK
jgi:hypothetical protein